MRILVAIFVTALLGSCNTDTIDLGISGKYMPDQSLLKKGLVWKYYVHIDTKGEQRRTIVQYTKFKIEEDYLVQEAYDNDLTLLGKMVYETTADTWKIKRYEYMSKGQIIESSIKKTDHLAWNSQEATSKTESEINGRIFVNTSIQKNRIDTMSGGTSKVIFKFNRYQNTYQYKETIEFTEGFGPSYRSVTDSKDQRMWELDEIFTSAEFEKRRNHGLHRIAYINPEEAMNPNSNWEICNHIDQIKDYYYPEKVELIGGKGRLRWILSEYLDVSKLGRESGYLTFRFVINCNGEAGQFVIEEANLEFEKKEFSNSLKNHLLELINTHVTWRPGRTRVANHDAYMYLTFKLKNGEIIEILP